MEATQMESILLASSSLPYQLKNVGLNKQFITVNKVNRQSSKPKAGQQGSESHKAVILAHAAIGQERW